MKKLLGFVLLCSSISFAKAQVHIVSEFPGYGLLQPLESPNKKIFGTIHTIDIGHVGLSFGDRLSLMVGAEAFFGTNNYSYHERYFEGIRARAPSLLYANSYEGTFYGNAGVQLQARYALRKSFLGPVEIGFKYAWRGNTFAYSQASEPSGIGVDPVTGYATVQDFRRYVLRGSYNPVAVPTITLRKYLNSNRVQFFIESYVGVSSFSVLASEYNLNNRWSGDEYIYAKPVIPEVGIKIAARWRREVHWFDGLIRLFEPIEE